MRPISTDTKLSDLEKRILELSADYGVELPEMRFFILDCWEFMSLLHKNVYPVAPPNMWEGKDMIHNRIRAKDGQESSLYYEVVQTGDPSYAYLNETNSFMGQASVMTHVVGHCNFSLLNVLHDLNDDRTEMIMYLTKKINLLRKRIGEQAYFDYWAAAESIKHLAYPHSKYNLDVAVDTESNYGQNPSAESDLSDVQESQIYSSTLDTILKPTSHKKTLKDDMDKKLKYQEISRKGYKLKYPCQDILGFLSRHAPAADVEHYILQYMYEVFKNHEFVRKTQIMNEGWAMYWEKKLMTDLFKEKRVGDIIDYCKMFSGVCRPRPYFRRNPYHLGHNLWHHIEKEYKAGKISLEYQEETNRQKKENWKKPPTNEPIDFMRDVVKSVTDFEFLRRFLTPDLIEQFHLNKLPLQYLKYFAQDTDRIYKKDKRHFWIDQDVVKDDMLETLVDFHSPRIYIVDADFNDGGLLLFHRKNSRDLRKDWIGPTLKNINFIWKNKVILLTGDELHVFNAGNSSMLKLDKAITFEQIVDKMAAGEKFVEA